MIRRHFRRIGVTAGVIAAVASVAVVGANAAGSTTAPAAVPGTLRVFAGPYEQAQFCESGQTPVISAESDAALAASPVEFGKDAGKNRSYNSLRATFEVAEQSGDTLITKSERIWPNGMVFNLALDAGDLEPGGYRFRLQATGGGQTSAWTSWCAFTVTP